MLTTGMKAWHEHPSDSSVDISVCKFSLTGERFDYLKLLETMVATDEIIKKESIGLGDEVFVTGLFVSHFGKFRNTPIVRVGNIASMPDEKVDTKDFGSIEAYLIEVRSIGGLSGSPVFVHLGLVRHIDGQVKFAQKVPVGGIFYLLGVMHGHWDRDENTIDGLAQDIDGGWVNMGIGIVVPATKILEILYQPEWVDEREKAMDEETKKQLPVKDIPSQDLQESDKQEFNL